MSSANRQALMRHVDPGGKIFAMRAGMPGILQEHLAVSQKIEITSLV